MLRKVVVLKSRNKVENNISSHLVTLSEQRTLGHDLLFPAELYHFTSAENLAFSLKRGEYIMFYTLNDKSGCYHALSSSQYQAQMQQTYSAFTVG